MNRRGFTLLEMLIVIAMIGILSSVAIVNFNSAREKANDIVAMQTMRSLIPVIQMCIDDNAALCPDCLKIVDYPDFENWRIPTSQLRICDNNDDQLWPILKNGWEYRLSMYDFQYFEWFYRVGKDNKSIECGKIINDSNSECKFL